MASTLSSSANVACSSPSLHERQVSSPQPPGSFLTSPPERAEGGLDCDGLRPPLDIIWLYGFVGAVVSILALATPPTCSIHVKPSPFSPQASPSRLPSRSSIHLPLSSSSLSPPLSLPRPSRPSHSSSRRHSYPAPLLRTPSDSSNLTSLSSSSSDSAPSSRRPSILHQSTKRPSHKKVSFSEADRLEVSEGLEGSVAPMLNRLITEEPEAHLGLEQEGQHVIEIGKKARRLSLLGLASKKIKKTKPDVLSPDRTSLRISLDASFTSPPLRSPTSNRSFLSPTSLHIRNPFNHLMNARTHSSGSSEERERKKEVRRTSPYEDGSFPVPV